MASEPIDLLIGAERTRSPVASAVRSVNLYGERNPEDAETPFTYYPSPGLVTLIDPGGAEASRCAYRATNGELYECVGSTIYFTDQFFVRHSLGSIAAGSTMVSMADNGIVLVAVDGTAAGYVVNLTTHSFSSISDAAFYGATAAGYDYTYFIFNRPNSVQFYLSPPDWNGTDPFDALDIASKIGVGDNIETLVVVRGQFWLYGSLSMEVWNLTGGTDFPFARVDSVLVNHGIEAVYSAATADVNSFLLGQDTEGHALVLMSQDYDITRISTHALEYALASYGDISDAIGYTYQQEGHTFYVITFPTADRTWAYDLSVKKWDERIWTDTDGVEHRHRAQTAAYAYGLVVCGDWQNGRLYQFDLDTYTDAGDPIVRRRGMKHIVRGGKRNSFDNLMLNMEPITSTALLTDEERIVSLRYSVGRGQGWSDPESQSAGQTGDFEHYMQFWQPAPIARDVVFEVFWSFPYKTALLGAWLEVTPAET